MQMPAAMRQILERELATIEQAMGPLVERKDAILKLMDAYQGNQKPVAGSEINSIEMAQIVIRNAGRPLQLDQIVTAIVTTYGVSPVKTLYQMLYKRAKAGDKFLRNEDGSFGLIDMMPEVRTIHSSGNADHGSAGHEDRVA